MLFDMAGSNKLMLGIDLGNETSQISFLSARDNAPQTLSVLAGAETYDIPTALCKRTDVNQWFFGREAVKHEKDEDAVFINHLVELAYLGETLTIGGESIDPVAMLALFVKRSMNLLSMEFDMGRIGAVMFTTAKTDHRMVEVLREVVETLTLPTKNIFFQSYAESLYYYMLNQPEELRGHTVYACDYHFAPMRVYELSFNTRTTPIVATVEEREFAEMEFNPYGLPEASEMRTKAWSMLDARFLEVTHALCQGKVVSSVYLLGEGFRDKWMRRSLEYLCRTRKVFQGSNLFSKGASYAAASKLYPTEKVNEYLLLGEEKLRVNVGMQVKRRGEEGYFALLDAGINWFDAGASADIILDGGDTLLFTATPITGGTAKTLTMTLDPLPAREPRTTRMNMELRMTSVNELMIRVTDLGFGEYEPPSGNVYTEVFTL